MNYYAKRKSSAAKVLTIVLLLLILAAAFFIIDKVITENRIAAIDSISYQTYGSVKGWQFKYKGYPVEINDDTTSFSDNIYYTPAGFSIISYSENWTGQKLIDVYEELMKNAHGKEINYLSEVDIYPGGSDIDTSDFKVAGTQQLYEESYSVFFEAPSIIPESMNYNLKREASVISLYNMDKYATASQAASTIAHEYGHHYTIYYFLQSDEDALNSQYYNLRSFASFGHDPLYSDQSSYYENHQWDIYEIAAEDYVQLMGSPGAKNIGEYLDAEQILRAGRNNYKIDADANTENVFPQENIYIPLACEVEGLRDYYYSFIGRENGFDYAGDADFDIRMSSHSKNGFRYYDITWTKTSADENAIYTLICYDKNGNIYWPVKTVRGNEEPSAIVGKVSNNTNWLYDTIPDEDRLFKLYLILPDGQMQASEIFEAHF